MSVAQGDAVALARALVERDSRNPSLTPGAAGELEAAQFLGRVLRAWGLRVELMEAAPGRPNVIARAGAARPGCRTLMFNGHLDTVGVEGMVHAPFDPVVREGCIFGRGSADMKGGVAAMCAAAVRAADAGLAGEVIVAAVVDEEYRSAGTSALVAAGVTADGAIVTEPTRLEIHPAHKGFSWITVRLRGRAAHGSRSDIGVDAIRHAGLLLTELDRLEREELTTHRHPLLGHASLHAATVTGGTGWSTYPDQCTLTIERRTVPGEDSDGVMHEVRAACAAVRARVPSFDAEVEHVFSQAPSDVASDAAIVQALECALAAEGHAVVHAGMSAWTDAALLNAAGIPAILFGPGDIARAHAAEEFVEVEEVEQATAILTRLALEWCSDTPGATV